MKYPSLLAAFLFALAVHVTSVPVAAADELPSAAGAEGAAVASGETPQSLLAQLPEADYARKAELLGALARTGHPRVLAILEALNDGRLFSDGKGLVAIEEGGAQKSHTDALSGEPVADAAGMTKIRVNNSLRRDLRGLKARLSLTSADPKLRRAAALDAFTARNEESLPFIEEALAKETVPFIRETLSGARAAILLGSASASEEDKLAAIATLKPRADREALNILMGSTGDGSEKVAAAAAEAAADIRNSLAYWAQLQNVYYGLSLGSVLLLAAIGLAITFGVMGVINMAHGEMIMLGAYTTFVVQQVLASVAPGLMEWSLPIAIPAAFIVSGSAGILIERFVIRFLYGRPLETLLATWGLSLILQQGVRTIFGTTNKPVSAPSWMSGSFEIGQLSITWSRLSIIVFAMIVLALLMVFLRRTHFGMQMRAVTQNRKMAASMGIRTNWVDALTFGLGSGVAGIAGVALSQIDNVSPNLGQSYIIDSFLVVVFGGVGNLWGTLVGALTLGIANKFLEPMAGAVVGKILVLVFIILFIQRRPRGLFALKGRSVEA